MNVTYKTSQGETVQGELVARHTDYAVPMNEVRVASGRTAMLKDAESKEVTSTKITRVNFTCVIAGGMWLELANGSRRWEANESIIKEVGKDEFERLLKIAMHDGMTGMWYNADNGRNVFDNGLEVN